MRLAPRVRGHSQSLSARRAWIEMIDDLEPSKTRRVALRKESVDRNPALGWRLTACLMVALRKESVDRNPNYIRRLLMSVVVALRKESVDRNILCGQLPTAKPRRSPQGERG